MSRRSPRRARTGAPGTRATGAITKATGICCRRQSRGCAGLRFEWAWPQLYQLVRVLRDLVAHKVALIIPSAGIDTSKVPGKVILDMLDAIEEFKREAIRQGINEGLAHAKARGVRLGRPTKVNAYCDDVARLRARGLTDRSIAKELSIPNSNVFKLIKGTGLKR
jgi:DNA invertase Pin-like site-specific DNA recombinase